MFERHFDNEIHKGFGSDSLRSITQRMAEQIGACRFWRLSHDYTSANLELSGALLDFGGFYGLRNWQRVRREHWLSVNQADLDDLIVSLRTVCFFAQKYVGIRGSIDLSMERIAVQEMATSAFMAELGHVIGTSVHQEFAAEISQCIMAYYDVSQKLTVDFTSTPPRYLDVPWLGDCLKSMDAVDDQSPITKSARKIMEMMRESCEPPERIAGILSRLSWALSSRDMLQIEVLQSAIRDVVSGYELVNAEKKRALVDDYINRTLTFSRRRFNDPDGNVAPVGFASLQCVESVVYLDFDSGHYLVRITCYQSDEPAVSCPILRDLLVLGDWSVLKRQEGFEYTISVRKDDFLIADWAQSFGGLQNVNLIDANVPTGSFQ
jgi:hypothetical protein